MDVYGSTACTSQAALAVNAGLETTFPWLAGIADKYDKYKFHELEFEYVPIRGTDVSGEVGIMFDPDTLDAAPTSMSSLLQSQKSVSGAPWREIRLRVGKSERVLFSRSGHPTAVSVDLKTYDVGRLHVLTCGMADASQVGYLMVHYAVELIAAQLTESDQYALYPNMAQYRLTANFDLKTYDDTSYHPLATSLFTTAFDSIGITLNDYGFQLPPGVFKVTGCGVIAVVTTATVGYGVSRVRIMDVDSSLASHLAILNTDNANLSDSLQARGTDTLVVHCTSDNPVEIVFEVYYDAAVTGADASSLLLGTTGSGFPQNPQATNLLIERVAIV
jgi:hypothetical protein